MRQAFIETLEALAAKDKNIFLLNGDLGFSVLEGFTAKFPGRSLNMAVAEQNMVGVAAGLALSGKTVFVYSIIPFVTMRVFEQVRNDIVLQNANVKIVGVGSGLTYGQLGPTHHSIEDIALMRVLPNMTVLCPGDPFEARALTEAAAKIKGPVYLRIGKKGEPVAHQNAPKLKVGKGFLVQDGKDITLVATGNMLYNALVATKLLGEKGVSARLLSLYTVKPIDAEILLKAVSETRAIFTLEEHSVMGGLGSAVAETLLESGRAPKLFYRFGIRDVITKNSGSQEYLRSIHGLLPGQIAKKIFEMLKRNKL
ncbi:MAG: transketolase C-terminal domain-containing protein [Patescibacteria group bacterium]